MTPSPLLVFAFLIQAVRTVPQVACILRSGPAEGQCAEKVGACGKGEESRFLTNYYRVTGTPFPSITLRFGALIALPRHIRTFNTHDECHCESEPFAQRGA
jgi:hypothetical protein